MLPERLQQAHRYSVLKRGGADTLLPLEFAPHVGAATHDGDKKSCGCAAALPLRPAAMHGGAPTVVDLQTAKTAGLLHCCKSTLKPMLPTKVFSALPPGGTTQGECCMGSIQASRCHILCASSCPARGRQHEPQPERRMWLKETSTIDLVRLSCSEVRKPPMASTSIPLLPAHYSSIAATA